MGRKPKKTDGSLTDFELDVMNIIWGEGPSTVHDVQAHFRKKNHKTYAYTTLSTILRLLEKKGFLSTTSFGRTHVYRVKIKREDYISKALNSLMDRLFLGSQTLFIRKFIEENKLSNKELNEIQEVIKRKMGT